MENTRGYTHQAREAANGQCSETDQSVGVVQTHCTAVQCVVLLVPMAGPSAGPGASETSNKARCRTIDLDPSQMDTPSTPPIFFHLVPDQSALVKAGTPQHCHGQPTHSIGNSVGVGTACPSSAS